MFCNILFRFKREIQNLLKTIFQETPFVAIKASSDLRIRWIKCLKLIRSFAFLLWYSLKILINVSMVLECSELMLLLIGPSSMQKKNFPSTSLAYLTHKCFMLVIFSQYDSVVLSYNCRAFIRLATDGFSILQIVLTSRSIKDIKCHMQKIESLSVILNLNYNSIK